MKSSKKVQKGSGRRRQSPRMPSSKKATPTAGRVSTKQAAPPTAERSVNPSGGAVGRANANPAIAFLLIRLRASWRFALLLLVVLGALRWFDSRDPVPRAEPVTIDIVTGEGRTTFEMQADPGYLPLLCDCEDPTFSGMPWYGILMPLKDFYLTISPAAETQTRRNLQSTPWRLRMVVVEPGESSDDPGSLPMGVTIYQTRGNTTTELFRSEVQYGKPQAGMDKFIKSVGVKEVTVIHSGPMRVLGSEKWPVSVLTPPPGSQITTHTTAGAREFQTARLDLKAHVEGSSAATRSDEVLDLAGRTNTVFKVRDGDRIFLGSHALPLQEGASISIVAAPPLTALRMSIRPVTTEDIKAADEFSTQHDTAITTLKHLKAAAMPDETGSVPPHDIHISYGTVPSASDWASFNQDAAPRGNESTGWPPIPEQRDIEIYGRISKFETADSVSTTSTDSWTRRVSKGESIEITPKPAFSAGKWTPSLTLSTGPTRSSSTFSGKALVSVSGHTLTEARPSKRPVTILLFVLTALATITIERFVSPRPSDKSHSRMA